MRSDRRMGSVLVTSCLTVSLVVALSLAARTPAPAQGPSVDELVSAVVGLKTMINPDAVTAEGLGREREGSGIVIDANGLVLTIGYLMVEAHAAELTSNDGHSAPADIVGYDHETGFGLLRALAPLKVRPIALGKSAELKAGDPVLIASAGGPANAAPARVVARREFAGGWEYLLNDAIFTAPPHPAWSGAALINREGKLVGVGSLIVADATGEHGIPGNMFVPIDLLPPILGDLIATGRTGGPARPWLGMTTEEKGGRLMVSQVTPGGPAQKAGIARGDMIVGVGGAASKGMADFYRKVWALGAAGATVPLDVQKDNATRRFDVKSMNRLDSLKLKQTF